MARGRRGDGDEPVRTSWHGMNQPRPEFPLYLRPSKRLKGLDEFEDPYWKGRMRWQEDRRRTPVRKLLFAARPFILLAALFVTWAVLDPALVEPPMILAGTPEKVSAVFTVCGEGTSQACVIDGDTFKLGSRRVRVIGIDAPETHPSRCAEEARLGELATVKLQALLDQGPFEMAAPIYGSVDRYGRDLRVISRPLPDGSTESIASEMRESGLARRYLGGLRGGWC